MVGAEDLATRQAAVRRLGEGERLPRDHARDPADAAPPPPTAAWPVMLASTRPGAQRRAMFARLYGATTRVGARHPFKRELAFGVAGTALGMRAEKTVLGVPKVAAFLLRRGRVNRALLGAGIGLLVYGAADAVLRRAVFGRHQFKASQAGARGALAGIVGGVAGGTLAGSPAVRGLARRLGARARGLR